MMPEHGKCTAIITRLAADRQQGFEMLFNEVTPGC